MMAETKVRGVTLLSAGFLIPPYAIWALFIYVFASYPGLSLFGRIQIFLNYFPGMLRSQEALSAIVVVCSLTAIVLGLKAFSHSSGMSRFICVVSIVLGAFITLLQAFTML